MPLFRKPKSEPKTATEVDTPLAQPTVQEITLEQLSDWIQDKEKRFLGGELQVELANFIKSIQEFGWRIDQKLNNWGETLDLNKLKFSTVGEINYLFTEVQALTKLLNTKKTVTLKNAALFLSAIKTKTAELKKKLENSSASTELGEIFSNDSPLWKDIAEVEVLCTHFEQKMSSSGLQNINILYKIQALAVMSLQNLEQLQGRLKINQDHLKLTVYSQKEKEKELDEYKSKSDYSSLQQREEQVAEILPLFEETKDKIIVFFSPLYNVLKLLQDQLLQEKENNEWLTKYIKNYLSAFYEDQDLAIMALIRKIDQLMHEGKIEVDGPEQALIKERIEQVNSGVLREIHKDYCKLKQHMSQAESLNTDVALLTKVDDLKYRMDHFHHEEDRLRKSISEIEQTIVQIKQTLSKAQDKFSKVVLDNFGEEAELVLPAN